jgi:hypothetical protein
VFGVKLYAPTDDLTEVPYNSHLRLASLDVNNMYVNIPKDELIPHITVLCNWHNTGKEIEQDIIKIMEVILKQNYFQFNDNIYTQTKGLAMGAPTSSVLSEIYLQSLEHTIIFDILIRQKIIGYYRYLDDILLVYDTRLTEIEQVLHHFNRTNKGIQFTLEQEQNNSIHYLDLIITRTKNNFQFKIYRKPTTDATIPADSCHPTEHKMSAIRYRYNRNQEYMTTPEDKQQENKIINHMLQANKYNILHKMKQKKEKNKKTPTAT